jgi:hypothetical protein
MGDTYISQRSEELRAWDSTTWFRIWQFHTSASNRHLQMHILAGRFVFCGWWSGFSWRGTYDQFKAQTIDVTMEKVGKFRGDISAVT